MGRTVLIPTNFDDFAQPLVDFCAGTKLRGIDKCIIVHIIDSTGIEEPFILSEIKDKTDKLNKLAQPIRDAGIETVARVVTGDPLSQIRHLLHQEAVDVMVVGTTAKSSLRRLFTGSLSEDLAYSQSIPTLLLRDDLLEKSQDVMQDSVAWSRTLVVPIDYSAASARAVLQCTKFEPESIGEVRLLHVLTACPRNQTMESCIQEQEFRLSAFSRMLEDVGIKAVPVVREGTPLDGILDEIRESGATGVVIGSNSQSRFNELFLGSTAREVVSTVPVFTMVVP